MPNFGHFITFTTYGTHLHGHEAGSVNRRHNRPGDPLIAPDARRMAIAQSFMKDEPYRLDEKRRQIVFDSIIQHLQFRGWEPIALHVRSTHVHLVIRGVEDPNRAMDEIKSYASRALNQSQVDHAKIKRWTRHGSTRWLDSVRSFEEAVQYTVMEQGEPMQVFLADAWERYCVEEQA